MKNSIAIIIILAVAFAGCSSLDVVGRDSVRAFGEILDVLPAQEYEPHRWRLSAPDNSAWLLWDNGSIDMVVDAGPFIAAGLNAAMLENCGKYNGVPAETAIYFGTPGFDMLDDNAKDAAFGQFKSNIAYVRKYVGYHSELDHYNISLGNFINLSGDAMFEWAKDMTSNDKDIVFVLNPEPIIAAGVDPENIDGWVYAQVTAEENGRPVRVWKLFKVFDLK